MTKELYAYIEHEANSNMSMQGLSGIWGFPFNLIGDALVIFTHYRPMMDHIRGLYGMSSATDKEFSNIVLSCKAEIMSDLIVDKIVGSIPVIGIAANVVCAEALTWRFGILIAMLAFKGEKMEVDNITRCARKIREKYPIIDSLSFQKPTIETVVELIEDI